MTQILHLTTPFLTLKDRTILRAVSGELRDKVDIPHHFAYPKRHNGDNIPLDGILMLIKNGEKYGEMPVFKWNGHHDREGNICEIIDDHLLSVNKKIIYKFTPNKFAFLMYPIRASKNTDTVIVVKYNYKKAQIVGRIPQNYRHLDDFEFIYEN